MDLYKTRQCHPYHRFKYVSDTGENLPVQVTFLHDGRAAACGSTDGNVVVWDIANEEQIQILPHNGMCAHQIMLIVAYCDLIRASCSSNHGNCFSSMPSISDHYHRLINTETSHYSRRAHLTPLKTHMSIFGVQKLVSHIAHYLSAHLTFFLFCN